MRSSACAVAEPDPGDTGCGTAQAALNYVARIYDCVELRAAGNTPATGAITCVPDAPACKAIKEARAA